MDEIRISPAGDGFYAAANHRPEPDRDANRPHGCIGGYVYIGHMVEDEHGEEVEVYTAVRCRRCQRSLA